MAGMPMNMNIVAKAPINGAPTPGQPISIMRPGPIMQPGPILAQGNKGQPQPGVNFPPITSPLPPPGGIHGAPPQGGVWQPQYPPGTIGNFQTMPAGGQMQTIHPAVLALAHAILSGRLNGRG